MMNNLKGFLMGIFLIISSIFMGGLGVWLFWTSYIAPFLSLDPEIISADSWFIVSFLLGSSSGFFSVTPVNVGSRLLRNKELQIKTIIIVTLFFGTLAFYMNIQLYQKIIYPNDLIECPLKMGYKENLLRDYVKDLSLCEK